MLPTLVEGQSVVAVRTRRSWNRLERGDIVVFRHLEFPNRVFIKRVVGFPDEQVRVENGAVFVDDVFLEEPYLNGQNEGRPELNRTWWNGNRLERQDSRTFGPVDGALVLGRVWLRCWPLRRWAIEPGRDGRK